MTPKQCEKHRYHNKKLELEMPKFQKSEMYVTYFNALLAFQMYQCKRLMETLLFCIYT